MNKRKWVGMIVRLYVIVHVCAAEGSLVFRSEHFLSESLDFITQTLG